MSAPAAEHHLLDQLGELVACESPSSDPSATARCADAVDEIARHHIGEPARRVTVNGNVHLHWQWGTPRVMLLGHFDTVWPIGTLRRWPFEVNGDRASGPGVFDMKAGVVAGFAALAEQPRLDGVAMLLTSDEEIGSPTSAQLVRQSADGVDAVLVLEPSERGALKVARKGVTTVRVRVTGRAAHAGLEPERGVNASIEAAHQILAISALADPDRGTTVTPTVVTAGDTVNTVPATATIDVDVRAETVAEMERVRRDLLGLAPVDPQARVDVCEVASRPPMERRATEALFDRAVRLGLRQGIALEGCAVGGGSDGNLTAAAGIPTLDGLGAVGGNAHAEGEWVNLGETWRRSRMLAALIADLLEAK